MVRNWPLITTRCEPTVGNAKNVKPMRDEPVKIPLIRVTAPGEPTID